MKSTQIKKQKLSLYNLIFHFNDFTYKWSCYSRNDHTKYFNGKKCRLGKGEDIQEAYKNYKNEQ